MDRCRITENWESNIIYTKLPDVQNCVPPCFFWKPANKNSENISKFDMARDAYIISILSECISLGWRSKMIVYIFVVSYDFVHSVSKPP